VVWILFYGSAGGRVITAVGGRSYKENSRFKRKVATVTTGYIIPADRLYGSYCSAYGFFCLPCPILFVIVASIIGPQTPLDFRRCDGYGLINGQFNNTVWDEPFLLQRSGEGGDQVIWRCVHGNESLDILESLPQWTTPGDIIGANLTANRSLMTGFFGPLSTK
ncbi:hypothetical protein Tco_0825711, partial [Tanacetum coccineum]